MTDEWDVVGSRWAPYSDVGKGAVSPGVAALRVTAQPKKVTDSKSGKTWRSFVRALVRRGHARQ